MLFSLALLFVVPVCNSYYLTTMYISTCHFTFKIYFLSLECYIRIISICYNQHSYQTVCCQILMHCRLCGFCFFFLLAGWRMCFLRIQYRGKQYSLPMVLRCISYFFYLPHPIIQMFGFLHTSKSLNFIVWICLSRWFLFFQFEISSTINAHNLFLAFKVFTLVLPVFHTICAGGGLLCYKLNPCCCLWQFQEWGKFVHTITSIYIDLMMKLRKIIGPVLIFFLFSYPT